VSTGSIHLFGVRHHGPGSARSLVHALEALRPACILIEGPPEANGILPLAVHHELNPPVALLIYPPERTDGAVLYPFAKFSPEWQAIRFALARRLPVRFIDLPCSGRSGSTAETPDPVQTAAPGHVPTPDPLGEMARAAGYSDAERWWDHLVESRSGRDLDVFTALHEMITALRTELDGQAHHPAGAPLVERLREAHMRSRIRDAVNEGFTSIAVVCGAYHTPGLAAEVSAREDSALLESMARSKMEAAWVPWSYERLSIASGYGAGIESPLWYELLWEQRGTLGAAWITRAARLLREEDVPISSAHVIETCRLADSLSALRGRPIPGLPEYHDAAVSVLGNGDSQNLRLIHSRWHYDGRLGKVPAAFPAAPLQRDLEAAVDKLKKLPKKAGKVRLELGDEALDLDLRESLQLECSLLLRRLRILGIEWGTHTPAREGKNKGSFHEYWRLSWQPEMMILLIEASRLGHTVEQAAGACLAEKARTAPHLEDLVGFLQDALLADLPAGLAALVAAINDEAAASTDVPQLLAALPQLAEVQRYGNVRGTDTTQVAQILAGLVPRMLIGLPLACTGIDDDAARALWKHVREADRSLGILGDPQHLAAWHETLARLGSSTTVHPLLAGCAGRLRYDAHVIERDDLARTMSLALSGGAEPQAAAAWVEGLLSGGAALLLHDDTLRTLLDDWVRGITHEHFVQSLPMLRRTFAQTDMTERRALGERLTSRQARAAAEATPAPADLDAASAAAVLPVLTLIWSKDPA
jgi:hypothetical protein